MNKKLENNKRKLKKAEDAIHSTIEEKELDELSETIKSIEQELDELNDPIIKNIYYKKLKNITNKKELEKIQREIELFQEDILNTKKKIAEQQDKLTDQKKKKEKYQDCVDDLTTVQNQFIQKINEAIRESEKIRKNVEKEIQVIETVEVIKKRQSILLDSLLLIYLAKSNMDKMIKLPLTLAIIHVIYEKLQEKEEVIIHYDYRYEDVQKTIDHAMNSIDDIENEMKNSLDSVQYTIKNFEIDFQDFCHLKEFQDILDMLQTVEKSIQKEFETVQEIQDDLEKSFDINKEKVLKIDSCN